MRPSFINTAINIINTRKNMVLLYPTSPRSVAADNKPTNNVMMMISKQPNIIIQNKSSSSSSAEVIEKYIPTNKQPADVNIVPSALLFSKFDESILVSDYAAKFIRSSVYRCMIHRRQSNSGYSTIPTLLFSEEEKNLVVHSFVVQDLHHVKLVYIPTTAQLKLTDIMSSSYNATQREEDNKRNHAEVRKRLSVVKTKLKSIMGNETIVDSVMLDISTGQIIDKSTSSSSSSHIFNDDPYCLPENGREALDSWGPHIIYIEGGSTMWLYQCLHNGLEEWAKLIRNACFRDKAVFLGQSAGAICACKLVETMFWNKPFDDGKQMYFSSYVGWVSKKDWSDKRGLGLFGNISIFPHMEDELENRIASEIQGLEDDDVDGNEVVCLTDQEILCVDGIRGDFTRVSIMELS